MTNFRYMVLSATICLTLFICHVRANEDTFALADSNNDGKISKEEYFAVMSKVLFKDPKAVKVPAEVQKLIDIEFSRLDVNKDGFITRDEYH